MDITFPARDEPLARIIAELSEPDAGRFADNLMTNEDSFASVVDRLESDGEIRGVYLGVGPDQNLTYLAHARPSLAFVVDFRRRNALVHLLHKALASIAPDGPNTAMARSPPSPTCDSSRAVTSVGSCTTTSPTCAATARPSARAASSR